MKIFLDTNVIIDIADHRQGEMAAKRIVDLFSAREDSRIFVSFLSVADAAYILRKNGKEKISRFVSDMRTKFIVLACTDADLLYANKIDGPDFEDCLQISVAESRNVDVILTRNKTHFAPYTEIPVLTPEEFVSHML